MGLYLLTSSWILGRGILELWGDLSLYSLFAFFVKTKHGRDLFVKLCLCGFPSLSHLILVWCTHVFGLQIRTRYVLCMPLLCAVRWSLPQFSWSSSLAASSFFNLSRVEEKHARQSEAVAALSISYLPTFTFAFEICTVEMNTSEVLAGGRTCR